MGKKRSYQWQAVPDEACATDYKTLPNDGRDAEADDRKLSRVMEGKFKGGQPIPPKVLDPRVARARARELQRQRHIQLQRGRRQHVPPKHH